MLEVKHVCYGIDGVPILKDISLGVQKGCIVTIVGPNAFYARKAAKFF